MTYVLFFLRILWYTLGALVICGLTVALCRKMFLAMMGNGFGRGVVLATSIVGTPIHELGHALMCLVFGHRITAMSLWQPRSKDGNLGFVTHTYRRRNPYHVLGNLFIGIGPIFSGLAVLMMALRVGFPNTFSDYTSTASLMASNNEGGILLFLEGLKMLPRIVEELVHGTHVSLWIKIPAILIVFSVSQHISLSLADIKGALRALPVYGILVLLTTVVCALIGQRAIDGVTNALACFSAYMTAFFVIVLVISLLQLLIALPVWLIRKLIGK